MTGKRKLEGRALGRDLGAIIGRKTLPAPPSPAAEKAARAESVRVENALVPRAGAASYSSSTVEVGPVLQNGPLGDAVGYRPDAVAGNGQTEQVAQTGTIFNNLRAYLISNFRYALSQAYVEIGLVQTIVDVPVDDALRGGIEIKSKQLDEEQLAELALSLERDDDVQTVGQAAKWNRLFGGGAVLILTDQDPETPLDLDAIGPDDGLEFRAVDLWELHWSKMQIDANEHEVRLDDEDDDELDTVADCYDYYGKKVHKSRVLTMVGITAPSFQRPRMRGWGVSVVETLVRSINQYLKATALGFEVLDEFKLDVFKIKGLTNTLLSPTGKTKIAERVQLASWQKNYQNAVVMDAEDDFDHKQLSFAGLAEAMSGIRQQVASDTRFPMTKLFGISSTGFNSGEDDIEVYNGMVEGSVRSRIKPVMLGVVELKCQKLFGMVPDDLTVAFKPLRVLSAVDEENVKTQKFNRLLQAKERGEITTEEFRDACNKGNLFDIALDTSGTIMAELDAEKAAAAPPVPPAAGAPGAGEGKAPAPKPATPPAPPKAGVGGKKAPVLNAADDAKAAFAERYGNVGEYHSSGDRDVAATTARELRKDGVHATIWHLGGPKTGSSSQWAVAVPLTARNAADPAAVPVLSQTELQALLVARLETEAVERGSTFTKLVRKFF